MNHGISTPLLLAAAYQCPPSAILTVDEFLAKEKKAKERARRIVVQKARHARRLRSPDLVNTVGS